MTPIIKLSAGGPVNVVDQDPGCSGAGGAWPGTLYAAAGLGLSRRRRRRRPCEAPRATAGLRNGRKLTFHFIDKLALNAIDMPGLSAV